MRGIFASCALVALLLAGAWADHHMHHHHNSTDHSHDSEMSCHKLSPPNADFAFALYKSLNAKAARGANIFYSPLGISTALSMLSTGAAGETHSQLFSSLGYSALNQTEVSEAYEHLFHMLGHSQENQQLVVGNAAAVRAGFSPLEKFVNDVKHYYAGEIFNVDFTKPAEAAAEINRFIANKTHDKIKDQVKNLDPTMAMVLINCIYFRGQWERPFDSDQTRKADFHVGSTTTVQVDMMRRTGFYDFYQDVQNHTTIIMLPYKGKTSMMIVLPNEGRMRRVERYINKDYIRHWHDSLYSLNVDLSLPKFSISADASLDSTLKEMGITDAFANNADFSGVSDQVKLKVSKIYNWSPFTAIVLDLAATLFSAETPGLFCELKIFTHLHISIAVSHQAMLTIDETGTEAAATTTLQLIPWSMPEIMTLDRPFLVFILEHSTRSILFMGKINNPTAA